LAGVKVIPSPQVTDVPMSNESFDELSQSFPDVFPVCAVTCAISKQTKSTNMDVNLADTFLGECERMAIKFCLSIYGVFFYFGGYF